MNRTPIVPAIGLVVGYTLAAVGVGASIWSLMLERSVWVLERPSTVWTALVFVGIALAQMSEVARIKKILGSAFPPTHDRAKLLGIGLILTVAILLLILK